jgi:hypothetical protein
MAAKYDWDYWRHRYVMGDDTVTLEWLSTQPNAPSHHRLKIKSSEQSWADQRKVFRTQVSRNATLAAAADATVQQTVQKIEQLVDAAEVISRHLRISRKILTIAEGALAGLSTEELNPKDIINWVSQATQIERLAVGLATERVEVDAKIDVSKLTDEQLERIAAGEDISKVL